MQKFLFENFLNNKKVYALNEIFWARQLDKLLPSGSIEKKNWLHTRYANGKKMYNGNPIFSVLIKPDKAIRIIQEQPESDQPEIGAWVDIREGENGHQVQELVISMELSDVTRDLAIQLMRTWSTMRISAGEMEVAIQERVG